MGKYINLYEKIDLPNKLKQLSSLAAIFFIK
ncbi:hypothetical protein OKW21_003905 [Catalinimonas alkaloidigena]|nr:hypothetical protein [Catalinimonas alkaloidigena]